MSSSSSAALQPQLPSPRAPLHPAGRRCVAVVLTSVRFVIFAVSSQNISHTFRLCLLTHCLSMSTSLKRGEEADREERSEQTDRQTTAAAGERQRRRGVCSSQHPAATDPAPDRMKRLGTDIAMRRVRRDAAGEALLVNAIERMNEKTNKRPVKNSRFVSKSRQIDKFGIRSIYKSTVERQEQTYQDVVCTTDRNVLRLRDKAVEISVA